MLLTFPNRLEGEFDTSDVPPEPNREPGPENAPWSLGPIGGVTGVQQESSISEVAISAPWSKAAGQAPHTGRNLGVMTDLLSAPLLDTSPIADRLKAALPTDVDYASARLFDERSEHLTVRQNNLEPIFNEFDTGVMISIWNDGGLGYAATADLSDAGLAKAVERARHWAGVTAGHLVGTDAGTIAPPPHHPTGSYQSPVEVSWDSMPLDDRLELLHQQSRLLGIDDRIVDWSARLTRRSVDTLLVTAGKDGQRDAVEQRFAFVYPGMRATANEGVNTQTRTFGANAFCGQGGAEVLGRFGFGDAASRVANEALELLTAPNCPSGVMDILLAPDQMILQIHESIGHPLRRRTQLRRHQLRHTRHVRLLPLRL